MVDHTERVHMIESCILERKTLRVGRDELAIESPCREVASREIDGGRRQVESNILCALTRELGAVRPDPATDLENALPRERVEARNLTDERRVRVPVPLDLEEVLERILG